ncbi:glycosyltransferase family 4 protein [Tabrizicola soli]|uniref:Glycosyltransferase family 4 protein n=1 Tax=Tabrizicola soli TaxID=2185115 RepID=A0ABV7DYK0_9RHOB|nr:glycosyltransferase family 4 protein [Tabrizicola soli]
MRRHRGYFTPHSGLIAKVLAGLGHEVVVLTAELPEGGGAVEQEDGAEIHYLAGTPPEKKGGRFWQNSATAFDLLHAERPFDIVFGRGMATWGFLQHSSFASEVPIVLHEGTYPRWLHQIESRADWLAPLLAFPLAPIFALKNRKAHAFMRRAARVVCNSPQLASALRRASWWRPYTTQAIVYGFDTSLYQPKLPSASEPARLVSLGRLAWDKGVLPMIDVVALLRDRTVTLECMGPGSDKVRRAAAGHARRRGISDRYTTPGPVQHEEVPQRLAGASVFLFPSTHAEGLPKVVLEAMATGLPVVAYRMPVLDSLIEDGVTGFQVPARSVRAMADRVDQLLANPALAEKMGAAARLKIETDFTPSAINAKWQVLLGEVLADTSARKRG